MARYRSFEDFWPYYLSEHAHPRDRHLHFVGTTGFFVAVAAAMITSPTTAPIAVVGMAAFAAWGLTMESRRGAYVPILGMLVLAIWGSPWLPAGVVCAYAMAWIGHFVIEKNRPATFTYPIWSFLCDFRMWSHMARGRLWSGDGVTELGLGVREPS